MSAKRILSALLALLMLCSLFTGTVFTAGATASTATLNLTAGEEASGDESDSSIDEPELPLEPVNPFTEAAQALDKEYAYAGDDLGATYTPSATTFKVWSPTAKEIAVKLYSTGNNNEEGAQNLGAYAMSKDMDGNKWTGCWVVTIEGDLLNVYYTYLVTSAALVTGVERTYEAVDPYAKAVGVNGKRGMVVDLDATDPEGWDDDKHVLVETQTDAIVWELVVRDFSASETSGVSEANRGKFLAFTEEGTSLNGEGNVATCVDYLKQLGITHVQLNPIFDFATVNETAPLDDQYNWGYDPENYNVPDGSYSSNPYDGNVRINECKQMIKALHDAGIGVIMDVVYNHTYFGGQSNFQQIVPNYYYRLYDKGAWSSASGCGNDTASERAMFRKFMIDSVMYWAEEYHIDGFRFDLMGVHDVETMNLIRQELDTIDPRILMYGEGWKASNTATQDKTTCTGAETLSAVQANADKLDDRIACFNDEIRNAVKGEVFMLADKGYVQGDGIDYIGIIDGVRANTTGDECEWYAKVPSQTVTYSSCHDNHTLYDRLVSSVYGSGADYRQRYEDLIAMNKMAAGMVLTSQGIPFMLAGEEMGRSKDGDDNSYKSAVELNAIDWSLITQNADLVSYYRGLIDIRKVFSPFNESTNKYQDSYTFYTNEVEVENPASTSSSDEFILSSDYVAFTVENDTEGEWKEMLVIFNPSSESHMIPVNAESHSWTVIANNKSAGLDALDVTECSFFEIQPNSMIIAVDTESYNALGIKSDNGKVIIKHVDAQSGKEIGESDVITGEIGSGYEIKLPAKEFLRYDFSKAEGTVAGKFTEEDIVVTYLYDKYVAPSLLKADIDSNGRVAIGDATTIQKHLASIITLDDEKLMLGDVDYSGVTNVKDVTMIQKYLADFEVSIGNMTVNYYKLIENDAEPAIDANMELVSSETVEYRVGAEYNIKPMKITRYVLNKEMSDSTKGIMPAGNITLEFYYEYATDGVTIYAAHLDETATWTPCLWAWSSKGNAFSSWPGARMEEGENGWFFVDTELPTDNFSIIISNNGTPQTADYASLSGSELWIVIDDYNTANKGNFITIYEEEPDLAALRAAAIPAE
ncbi:MAG: type I pullulanase [Ruminococcaceae bacterium]|nr:type I pullulanase [Oscillospiraceae bacterium]